MPKAELPVISLLLERQSRHPLLEGFPTAAQIGNLPLYLGEAGAAQVNGGHNNYWSMALYTIIILFLLVQDREFLKTNNIQAIIALGTGNLTTQPCQMLLIDILDMEDELLLPHFHECIAFIKERMTHNIRPAAVLVHCVYGQSRSAAICVAFLMAMQSNTLLEAYDEVQKARPCISINSGFLRQLELFGRMGNDPDIMGNTPAHAELRWMMARRQRMKTGGATITITPQFTRPGRFVCCRKCNYVLCTTRNQLLHSPVNEEICTGIYIEPMQWMTNNVAFVSSNDGKLVCPSCKAKLGSWNWIGVKCSCKYFVSPAFQLVPSRTEIRPI